MGVYHKFGSNEVLHSTIYASPKIVLASGTFIGGSPIGWHGNTGVSGSISLYEGVRSRTDVKSGDFPQSGLAIFPIDELDTHSIDRVVQISGSYPATGSVQNVLVKNIPSPGLTSIDANNWYEEHFRPIELLYNSYSRVNPLYSTCSYDYRSLFFHSYDFILDPDQNPASYVNFSSFPSTATSSFTLEFFIKPTMIAGIHDLFGTALGMSASLNPVGLNTLISVPDSWKFFITGSTGALAFTDNKTLLTGSTVIQLGKWQHVALTCGNGSASFFVNGVLDVMRPYTGSIATASAFLGPGYMIGADFNQNKPDPYQGFEGMMFESRIWDIARTPAQISSSYLQTLIDSGSSHLVGYHRFNDGPFSTAHGFSAGLGLFDYSHRGVHGSLISFDANSPLPPFWQPNDNPNFVTPKTLDQSSIDTLMVMHIPSMYYGRQIATGSVRLTDNSYSVLDLQRVIVDDGRGQLYISGSLTRPLGGEDYTGVSWNRVGNVFYSEGLIVISEFGLTGIGNFNASIAFAPQYIAGIGSPSPLELEFVGSQRIATKTFMCRMDAGACNASNNSTFSQVDPGDPASQKMIVQEEPVTYISAIGLYDDFRNLVAVAKLAQPIRKRERDRLNFKLRMDF